MEGKVTWTCNCGQQNDYVPDKQKLKCKRCEAVYWVRGLHVDGSPMLALIHQKEEKTNCQAVGCYDAIESHKKCSPVDNLR